MWLCTLPLSAGTVVGCSGVLSRDRPISSDEGDVTKTQGLAGSDAKDAKPGMGSEEETEQTPWWSRKKPGTFITCTGAWHDLT